MFDQYGRQIDYFRQPLTRDGLTELIRDIKALPQIKEVLILLY